MKSSTKWQEDVTAKHGKYVRPRFPMCADVPWKGMGHKQSRRVILGSLEPCSGQAVDVMVVSAMEDAEAQKFCQGTRQTGLQRHYYRTLFPGD